jgi:hypothetical protein
MEHLVSEHSTLALTDTQENAIESILKEARKYYREKGFITEEEWRLYQEDINSPDYPYA